MKQDSGSDCEHVPALIDALDCQLYLWIAESMLDDAGRGEVITGVRLHPARAGTKDTDERRNPHRPPSGPEIPAPPKVPEPSAPSGPPEHPVPPGDPRIPRPPAPPTGPLPG